MNSVILAAAARFISPVIFVVSLVLLYRGHNLPGGGFIGGLIAATAILLRDFAKVGPGNVSADLDSESEEDGNRAMPVILMIFGLSVAGGSAFLPVLFGDPFFTGYWLPSFSLPLLGKIHLGTPLIFDVGVYLTVIGFVVHSARSLKDDSNPNEPDKNEENVWN